MQRLKKLGLVLTSLSFQVIILESQNRIGGRVYDDKTLGKCIGHGAQILTGIINNPIAYMCDQVSLEWLFNKQLHI